jgi:hypothetical protein
MKDFPAELPAFSDGFDDLIDRRSHRGLTLRPPRRLLQLLFLAREHAAAVAYRPISFGNKGYLAERVTDLQKIGSAINDLHPRLKPAWQVMAGRIAHLLLNISSSKTKKAFDRIVRVCDQTKFKEYWYHETTYAPASDTPLLKTDYERILVVIGPGIGLGDEISCAELLCSLRKRFPTAEFVFWGYYFGVWPRIDPTFQSHTLTGHPMMTFECVDRAMTDGKWNDLLVVYINFTGLCFHLAFCLDRHRPDIVEIAVGQGKMWFMPRFKSPIQISHTMDLLYPENYRALRRLSKQLVGDIHPSATPKGGICNKKTFQMIISPLTSKPIFLTPADWADVIEKTLATGGNRKPVSCVVLPGMSASSADYARQIVEQLSIRSLPEFDINVLGGGYPLSADSAFSTVYQAMAESRLLIGIDTYTSHLAAMLSVASVNLCYERNIAFWPDVFNSWWIELRHDLDTITDVASLLFSLAGGEKNAQGSRLEKLTPLAELIAVDKVFSTFANVSTHKDFQNILTTCHAAWSQIPHRYRRLITEIDANYAWPRICAWLSDDRLDEKIRFWLVDIINKSHFRKFCAMIVHLGHHLQSLEQNDHHD